MNIMYRSTALTLALAALTGIAFAQSRSSSAATGVTNYDYPDENGNISMYALDYDYNSQGEQANASINQNFTGMNMSGQQQTMNFTANAYSRGDYGLLRTAAWGSLSNTYFNPDNPWYWNSLTGEVNEEGSPDGFIAAGWASYTDQLAFNGISGGYYARYSFFIHGEVQGGDAYTYLNVWINGNLESFTVEGTGYVGEYFNTDRYFIGSAGHEMTASLTSQFLPNSYWAEDGSTFSGASLFGNTVTLTGIVVEDEFGNVVDGWTVSSASGTNYPVPEPATMSILAAGALAIVARKRRRKIA